MTTPKLSRRRFFEIASLTGCFALLGRWFGGPAASAAPATAEQAVSTFPPICDALGRVTRYTYTYSRDGELRSIQDPFSRRHTITYTYSPERR